MTASHRLPSRSSHSLESAPRATARRPCACPQVSPPHPDSAFSAASSPRQSIPPSDRQPARHEAAAAAAAAAADEQSVSVVIPCYTKCRWPSLLAAVESVRAQTVSCETLVVVDHNDELFEQLQTYCRKYWDNSKTGAVAVLANQAQRGVSGTRNTGAFAASGSLVAFLDDDATATATWIAELSRCFRDTTVVGAGGLVRPVWRAGEPSWFPPEFGWVYGLTNLPEGSSAMLEVRNVWALNMMVRQEVFSLVDGFRPDFGKLGSVAEPEDTDLCLRMASTFDRARWLFTPAALVSHEVPAERSTVRYFLRRCWQEGAGKRQLLAAHSQAHRRGVLSSERTFLKRDLPFALRREARCIASLDPGAVARSIALIAGTAFTAAGFALTNVRRVRSNTKGSG
jgi:GT2 family glycosyltransferase